MDALQEDVSSDDDSTDDSADSTISSEHDDHPIEPITSLLEYSIGIHSHICSKVKGDEMEIF